MRPASSSIAIARIARASRGRFAAALAPAHAHAPAMARAASTLFKMPAMSPTMTEGGIAGWKVEEGAAFAAGDVLLEIETDKATIDVEAQDDGVLGKIISPSGSQKIPVGQIIAVLAEEGDDLSAIEVPTDLSPAADNVPKEDELEAAKAKAEQATAPVPQATSSATPKNHAHREIHHPFPLFPSVSRLLLESSLSSEEIAKLKGTGKNGMLTKGDVLVAIGSIKSPYGSAEKLVTDPMGPSGKRASEAKSAGRPSSSSSSSTPAAPEKPLDAAEIRRLIVQGLNKVTLPAEPVAPAVVPTLDAEFDAILEPYAALLPPTVSSSVTAAAVDVTALPADAVEKDEWAGLY